MDQQRPYQHPPLSGDPLASPPEPSEEDHQARVEYLRSITPNRGKQRGSHKGLIITTIIVLLIAAVVAAWFLGGNQSSPKKTTPTQTTTPQQSQSSKVPTTTTHYDSSNLSLGFDYPQGWTVTDTAGSGKLTAVSQPVQLKDTTGQTVTGQITLTVRNSQQPLTEFNAGSSTAALDSQKIAYSKPTASQRGNTYVSFLRYATDSSSTGLDGVYITGDAGYQAGQNIPKTDIAKEDPIVAITFAKCGDATCSGATTPMAITSSSWSDTSLSGPLMTMLESFSFM